MLKTSSVNLGGMVVMLGLLDVRLEECSSSIMIVISKTKLVENVVQINF